MTNDSNLACKHCGINSVMGNHLGYAMVCKGCQPEHGKKYRGANLKTCPTCKAETDTSFLDGFCHECYVYNRYVLKPTRLTSEAQRLLWRRANRLSKSVGVDEDGKKWYLDQNGDPYPFGKCFE